MRMDVIFNLVKEEWYDQRRVISGWLLGSLFLFLVLIVWHQQSAMTGLQKMLNRDADGTVSVVAFIMMAVPYFVFWLFLTSRPNREYVAGIYPFFHALPLTLKEIVTSRFVSRFMSQGVVIAGLSVGLWLFHKLKSIPIDVEVGAGMFIFPCFTLSFTAVQLGLFYRWGLRGEGISHILWAPIVLIIVFTELDDRLINQLTHWYTASPVLTVGLCALVVVLIWAVSWYWSMRNYDKYMLDS